MGAELGATDLHLPLRRADGGLPARHATGRTWPTWPGSTVRSCAPTARWRRIPRSTSSGSSRSTSPSWSRTWSGPHTPDLARPVSEVADAVKKEDYPDAHLGGPDRLLHQLLLRGHRAGRGRGEAGRRPRHAKAPSPCWSRRAPSRCGPPSSATGRWRACESVGAHGAGQRLRPLHRAVAAGRHAEAEGAAEERHHHLLQPQLPAAQRRQPGDAGLHRQPRDRHGLRAVGAAVLQSAHRRHHGTRREGVEARRRRSRRPTCRRRDSCATKAATWPPQRTASKIEITIAPESERLQALDPFPAWDGEGPPGPAAAPEGEGRLHHGPHLSRGAVAALPRAPGQDQRQHVHRRDQRLHRRGRHRRASRDRREGAPGRQSPGR